MPEKPVELMTFQEASEHLLKNSKYSFSEEDGQKLTKLQRSIEAVMHQLRQLLAQIDE